MSAVVSVSNVHKSFGALPVLKGVSFDVGAGEVVAVIGASGSGKSTALRCINALETIDSGEITVCDHKTRRSTDERCGETSASSSRATTSSPTLRWYRTSCSRRPA